jgi:hypothetical protein
MTNESMTKASSNAELTGDPHVALAMIMSSPGYAQYARFVFAILSSIPWVGSVIAAATALQAEREQGKVNTLLFKWVEEHQHAYKRLEGTVTRMVVLSGSAPPRRSACRTRSTSASSVAGFASGMAQRRTRSATTSAER